MCAAWVAAAAANWALHAQGRCSGLWQLQQLDAAMHFLAPNNMNAWTAAPAWWRRWRNAANNTQYGGRWAGMFSNAPIGVAGHSMGGGENPSLHAEACSQQCVCTAI